jgi:hypothetical protein
MAVFRLILLVTVLGGLALLLVQNWSPVLPLVFLGTQTQSLPLAMWVFFSTAAGAATSLFISILFRLSSYFAASQRQTPPSQPSKTPPVGDRTPPRQPQYSYTPTDKTDDWETSSVSSDWDFEETKQASPSPQNTQPQDSKTYERQQQPKSSYQSGSVYSYSYREPQNSGVGKTESIYDADYRVIIPPYQPPSENQKRDDEEDWGFLDDDDSDNQPSRR